MNSGTICFIRRTMSGMLTSRARRSSWRVSRSTSARSRAPIPALTAFYLLLCAAVLLPNLGLLPGIFRLIFSSAFSPRAAAGAAGGYAVSRALRFGVMRGIFSNEAGCGTSPTAHAAAETRSPAHQAALGVVEVVFDTHILCTLTALTLLTADARFGILPWHGEADAAAVTLSCFGALLPSAAVLGLRIAVALFAYSSIIAQYYYGSAAVRFLTRKKTAAIVFGAAAAAAPLIGAVISSHAMWLLADILLGTMTAVNCSVLLFCFRKSLKSAGIPR